MTLRLADCLSQQRKTKISLEIRERNLPAQKFFKSQEYRAITVLRNHYEDTEEDAYIFEYNLMRREEPVYRPRNRIAAFI